MADWRKRVEAATVRLVGRGGQGVAVRGGIVLTGTHCIDWSGTGAMALGDHFIEEVVTPGGDTLRLGPVFADPVADIAALAALDNQTFASDAEAFEGWSNSIEPLGISDAFERWCAPPPRLFDEQSFSVHCLKHTGSWVTGEAKRLVFEDLGPRAWMVMSEPIKGGTSGGPIVDDNGDLVGVMSQTVEVEAGPSDGAQPIAAYALPIWLTARIRRAGG